MLKHSYCFGLKLHRYWDQLIRYWLIGLLLLISDVLLPIRPIVNYIYTNQSLHVFINFIACVFLHCLFIHCFVSALEMSRRNHLFGTTLRTEKTQNLHFVIFVVSVSRGGDFYKQMCILKAYQMYRISYQYRPVLASISVIRISVKSCFGTPLLWAMTCFLCA